MAKRPNGSSDARKTGRARSQERSTERKAARKLAQREREDANKERGITLWQLARKRRTERRAAMRTQAAGKRS